MHSHKHSSRRHSSRRHYEMSSQKEFEIFFYKTSHLNKISKSFLKTASKYITYDKDDTDNLIVIICFENHHKKYFITVKLYKDTVLYKRIINNIPDILQDSDVQDITSLKSLKGGSNKSGLVSILLSVLMVVLYKYYNASINASSREWKKYDKYLNNFEYHNTVKQLNTEAHLLANNNFNTSTIQLQDLSKIRPYYSQLMDDNSPSLVSYKLRNSATHNLLKIQDRFTDISGPSGYIVGCNWKYTGKRLGQSSNYLSKDFDVALYNVSAGDYSEYNIFKNPPGYPDITRLYKDAFQDQLVLMKSSGIIDSDSTSGIATILNLDLPMHSGGFHTDSIGLSYLKHNTTSNSTVLIKSSSPEGQSTDDLVLSMSYDIGNTPAIFGKKQAIDKIGKYSKIGNKYATSPLDFDQFLSGKSTVQHKVSTMVNQGKWYHAGPADIERRKALLMMVRSAKPNEELELSRQDWQPILEKRISKSKKSKSKSNSAYLAKGILHTLRGRPFIKQYPIKIPNLRKIKTRKTQKTRKRTNKKTRKTRK